VAILEPVKTVNYPNTPTRSEIEETELRISKSSRKAIGVYATPPKFKRLRL